ncbi:MAG: hypothetical protein V4482_01370 [Pseudomonadota bacterium]
MSQNRSMNASRKPFCLNKKKKYLWLFLIYLTIFCIAKCDKVIEKWEIGAYDVNVLGVSFSVGKKATAGTDKPALMVPGKDDVVAEKKNSASTSNEPANGATNAPDTRKQAQPKQTSVVTKLATDVAGFDPLSTSSPKEVELLMKLYTRRQDLEKREAHLKERESAILIVEKQQKDKVEELAKLKESIESLLMKTDKTAHDQFANLVKVYEGMKPKSAAQVFEKLDIAVLKNLIPLMGQRKVSSILEQMNVGKAKELSLVLISDKNPFASSAKK